MLRLAEAAKQAAIVGEQEKAAQQRAAELVQANTAMQKTVDALGHFKTVDQFIPAVLTIVGESFQATSCAYYEHAAGDLIYLRVSVIDGKLLDPNELGALDPTMQAFVAKLASGFTIPDEYFGMPVRQRTQATYLDHAAGTGVPEFDYYCCNYNRGSELNVPCVIGDAAEGSLVIYRPSGALYSESEIALAETLAAQLALALQASRVAEEAKQTAIAREQEQAAQARAAELVKANAALQETLASLAATQDVKAFLEATLQEIVRQAGACASDLFRYDRQTNQLLRFICIRDGVLYPDGHPDDPASFRDGLSAANTPGYLSLIERPQLRYRLLEETCDHVWSDSMDWHHKMKHRAHAGQALVAGNKPVGFLGLAFRDSKLPTSEKTELIQALAHQMALALELTQLADKAKQGAILKERNRMARDIHDSLAQSFTGIIMQMEALKADPALDPEEIRTYLDRIGALARLGLSEARRSVQSLRPSALETANFPDALRHLLHQTTDGTTIQTNLHLEGSAYPLPTTVEENLLRIAQEAVANAIRHGHAQTITLQILFEPTALHLQIIDDGDGFVPYSSLVAGFGIIGMQERAHNLGGQFYLVSQPGQGTEIAVTVPIRG
jgi:signal transduction histidine kinase